MTAFWCESAWLTGGFARRVRLVTQDGLIKDVLVDADPAARRRPPRRA